MWPKSILLESQALSETLKCVEEQGDRELAMRLTREALSCSDEPGLSGLVLRCAMNKVLGECPTVKLPRRERLVPAFAETSIKWLVWATGSPLPEIPFLPEESCGAIQDLALTYWSNSVEALLKGEPSRKLFQRATEFSSSYGVTINQTIQWTYAASFFSTT